MAEERASGKLSAILSADVKGYSRRMGEDELATVETLKKYCEVITLLIQRYGGRVVDSPLELCKICAVLRKSDRMTMLNIHGRGFEA